MSDFTHLAGFGLESILFLSFFWIFVYLFIYFGGAGS